MRQDSAKVVIDVDDDGKGVPLDARERIFEPFYRLEDDLKTGMGLGLAIVRRIAELHDGTVCADASTLGGAKFRFTLPIA